VKVGARVRATRVGVRARVGARARIGARARVGARARERLEQAQLGSVVRVHPHAKRQQLSGRDLADLVRVRVRVRVRS
jgi:UDP-3-O-[3-hydroxymyristoyl] glucosamine N-acyltransferase